MARMIELLRKSAVPVGVMRTAAKGGLSLPPAEAIEVLVYLAENSTMFEDAQITLEKWDVAELTRVLVDSQTPREVLNYFFKPQNRRPILLLALCDNPVVSTDNLAVIAETASRETIEIMLRSERIRKSARILQVLLTNPLLTAEEANGIKQDLAALATKPPEEEKLVFDVDVKDWVAEHAAEIAAEEGKAFSLIGGVSGNEEAGAGPTAITAEVLATPEAKEEPERLSTIQKLAKLKVGERVQVAIKCSKDERSILILDGARVVSSAVLASPKVSEAEVENFASLKNVSENVLREIGRNRRFMKDYTVVKNLCNNPRTPIDLSLTLIKNLQISDLKSLSQSKNIPDTLRKSSMKLYKIRMAPPGTKVEY